MAQRDGFTLTVNDGRNEEQLKQITRQAVRGVIRNRDNYLLIRSDLYGEYKFPGGGMEEGESAEDTLVREVQEETGYDVDRTTIRYIGMVEEHRKGLNQDFFHMDSYYYSCQVQDQGGTQSLVAYEAEYGYRPVMIQLNEAIRVNESITDTDPVPWVDRDTAVMRYLKDQRETDIS